MKKIKKKWSIRVSALGFLILLLWGFLFAGFIHQVNNPENLGQKADGLVVLTGGSGRVDEGFKLLSEQKGQRLLLSGITQDINIETVMKDIGQDPSLIECCVDAENISFDTRTNATQVLAWAKKNKFKSLILITSDFHMPRTLLIFKEFEDQIILIPHPVHSEISPLGLAIEFNKYLLSLARFWLTA